jgi:hypothetical protein
MKKVYRINYILPNTQKEHLTHYSLLDNRRTFCNALITLEGSLLNYENLDWPVCKTCQTKLNHFDEYVFAKKDDPI